MNALRLQRKHIEQSIRRYVGDLVSQFAGENAEFSRAAGNRLYEISEKITNHADGMFLWAEIAWQSFKRGLLWNRDIIEERIQSVSGALPGLNSLYDTMLDQVDESIRKDMWTIFGIMATVFRPLNSKALGILLAMNSSSRTPKSSSDIDSFGNVDDIIQTYFPNLLRLEDDGSIKFIHLSFKEYLDTRWKDKDPEMLKKCQRATARSCLQYLRMTDVISRVLNHRDLRCECLVQKRY
jgi:hypothetical protein